MNGRYRSVRMHEADLTSVSLLLRIEDGSGRFTGTSVTGRLVPLLSGSSPGDCRFQQIIMMVTTCVYAYCVCTAAPYTFPAERIEFGRMQMEKIFCHLKRFTFLLLTAMLALAFGSCQMAAEQEEYGSLVLTVGSAARNIWEPDPADAENPFFRIAEYGFKLSGPDSEVLTIAPQESGTLVMDALSAGNWQIEVFGHNAAGKIVAELEEPETIYIQRGKVAAKTLTLLPVLSGTGELEVTVDWSAISTATDETKKLIYDNPKLDITVRNINDTDSRYEDVVWEQTYTETNQADSAVKTFSSMPVGWYEITAKLSSTNSSYEEYSAENERQYWQRIAFARIAAVSESTLSRWVDPETVTTRGTFLIDDATMFETGTVDLIIEEDVEPLFVELSSDVGSRITLDADETLGGSATALFSATEYAGASYKWYLNGISEQDGTSSTYSRTFSKSGKDSVTVVVIDTQAGRIGTSTMDLTVAPPPSVEFTFDGDQYTLNYGLHAEYLMDGTYPTAIYSGSNNMDDFYQFTAASELLEEEVFLPDGDFSQTDWLTAMLNAMNGDNGAALTGQMIVDTQAAEQNTDLAAVYLGIKQDGNITIYQSSQSSEYWLLGSTVYTSEDEMLTVSSVTGNLYAAEDDSYSNPLSFSGDMTFKREAGPN
jgi:hypothetical protein